MKLLLKLHPFNHINLGRQSLTRLAAYISEFYCFQIELSKTYGLVEWRDDVKKLLLRAGLQKRESVFLFSDTQVSRAFYCLQHEGF